MKCIIVDDEYKSIALLKEYITEVPFLTLSNTFRNPVEAINSMQNDKVELVFLDINMPRLTGIQVVKSLAVKPIIIFTTAYAQHAVEGFDLDAIDYLLKPITFERFLKAANKAYDYFRNEKLPVIEVKDYCLIKSGPQTYRIKRSDILYIEKDGNYTILYTFSGKIVTRYTFKEVFELLGTKGLIRSHKSFIVSIAHISMIESDKVSVNKIKIPIGATYREAFLKAVHS